MTPPIPLGFLDFPTAGGSAYDWLETQELSSTAATISFTGLNSLTDYKHLQVRAVTKGNNSSAYNLRYYFNGDNGLNYHWHYLRNNGSGFSANQTSASYIENGFANGVNDFGVSVIDILDFSNPNRYTTTRSEHGLVDSIGYNMIYRTSGGWKNTVALTSMTFYPNTSSFAIGTRLSLYGLRG